VDADLLAEATSLAAYNDRNGRADEHIIETRRKPSV
jgi:hypothetical protein